MPAVASSFTKFVGAISSSPSGEWISSRGLGALSKIASPTVQLSVQVAKKRVIPFLEENIAVKEPHQILQQWLAEATEFAPQSKPRVATLATVDGAGQPVTRLTTIEEISAAGLTFYTTLGNKKPSEITGNPHVSLQFHWPQLMRSLRISGFAQRLSNEQALQQFRTYPRQVQLNIYIGRRQRFSFVEREQASPFYHRISDQLSSIFGRQYSEEEEESRDHEIPLPEHWGGFLVKPCLYDFNELSADPHTGIDRLRFRCSERLSHCIKNRTINADHNSWVFDDGSEKVDA